MHQDDYLWDYSPQKRAREELSEFSEVLVAAQQNHKMARTRSIERLGRVSSQHRITDMLEFGQHAMLESPSFDESLDFASGPDLGLRCDSCPYLAQGEALAFDWDSRDASFNSIPSYMSDMNDTSDTSDRSDMSGTVDEGRFKLVSLLGYRKSLWMASVGSKHVASGVPFMMPDNIQECLVSKPDIVTELRRCF